MTRQARWQAARRQAGRCTICGKGPLVSQLRCGWCLVQNRRQRRATTRAHARRPDGPGRPPILLTLAFALVLAGCGGGGGGPTGPTPTWRGAAVFGDEAAIETALEPAWQQTPQDWEPRGWTIVIEPERFPCAGARHAGADGRCRGTTSDRRVIRLIADVAVARWELGNARRYDQTGRLEDRGCC